VDGDSGRFFEVITPLGFSVRNENVPHIKVIHDPLGQTLTVYWDDPEREEVCEEIGQGIILIKDAQGEVIGFERLYFKPKEALRELGVVLQTAKA
jgi:hypothetical protein